LLAFLLLHANRAVSSDSLTDAVWGEARVGAGNRLQMAIARLRKALEPLNDDGEPRLRTVGGGYLLSVGPGELDADVFGAGVQDGQRALAAGNAAGAVETLERALGLWRGPPLAEVAFEDYALSETRRLEELRLVAIETRIDAQLALGRQAGLVGELEGLVNEEPTRERFAAQLMIALYRCGRQADALDVYQRTRARMARELGLEPGPALKALQAEILEQGRSLEPNVAPECAELTVVAPPVDVGPQIQAREHRKTVTALFVDLVGSTVMGEQLDPETLRALMVRYYGVLGSTIDAHGGSVEKFIGDAVVAIFGIPVAHEDDALRTVRAAVDARRRLGELNQELEQDLGVQIETRTGINTGEVVVGDRADGEQLVVGDAMNVAARLEQSAQPGETLLGESTYALVRHAVRAERLEPLEVKGKAAPLIGYRLLGLVKGAGARERRRRSPLVGRAEELRLFRDAYVRAGRERTCHMFTVLGSAGVGKSRLIEEAAAACDDATVVSGRCLPYGEGITFWPLAEILRAAAGIGEPDSGEETERKLAALVESDGAAAVASILASVIGASEGTANVDESFWAVRKLFESIARRSPLIVVFEDVHWAAPTLLDLIEHVADMSRDAPIVITCIARPELLDTRPGWGGGKRNAASIHLEPLSREASAELIQSLLDGAALPTEVLGRIAAGSEGFPLFVEEMVAMLGDQGLIGGDVAPAELARVTVPPTIRALLAARLDGLPVDERRVLELASVVGREFWQAAISALTPTESSGATVRLLEGLVRRDLIVPERSTITGDDSFR
jgi:class 3 adenylate cyclase